MTTLSEHPLVAPWDGYNQELVSQVHPPDWANPAPAIRQCGDAYNRTRLTPTVKKWMGRWLARQRKG